MLAKFKSAVRKDHPHGRELFYDADFFWRWCPETWSARDRAARRRVSGGDVYDLQQEVARLGRALEELRATPLEERTRTMPHQKRKQRSSIKGVVVA